MRSPIVVAWIALSLQIITLLGASFIYVTSLPTKADLNSLRNELKEDIKELRNELREDIKNLEQNYINHLAFHAGEPNKQ